MAKVWRRHGEGSTQLLPRKHVAIGYIFGMLSEREKSSGAGVGSILVEGRGYLFGKYRANGLLPCTTMRLFGLKMAIKSKSKEPW